GGSADPDVPYASSGRRNQLMRFPTLGLIVLVNFGGRSGSGDMVTHLQATGAAGSALHAHSFVIHQASAKPVHVAQTTAPTLAELIRRNNLNPARFAQFHPLLGPVVSDIARLEAGQCTEPSTLVRSLLARHALNPT